MKNNKKKVIYFVNSSISERDLNRFGIETWINYGWKVKVFDISKILYSKSWNDIDVNKKIIDFEELIVFKNMNNLLSELNKLKNKAVFIDLLGASYTENRIRKTIKAFGVLVGINLGSIPQAKISSIWEKISLLKRPIIFLNALKENLKYNFKQILLEKIVPDYVVVGGTKSMLDIKDNKTSIIKAHNFDYDFFLKKNIVKQNKYSNFLVFLDEDGPYHSDFVRLGIKPYVTKENYYSAIDRGLNEIAKLLNLNIKIAAHPRSNYENKQIKYKHPILQNQTFELVRDADVVVGHSSTALQLAVIMNKPIIFVTTNEIQNAHHAKPYLKLINSFASILGKKIINLDDCSEIKNFSRYLEVDKKKYKKYIQDYVKTENSPKKFLWEIVINKIENDLFNIS